MAERERTQENTSSKVSREELRELESRIAAMEETVRGLATLLPALQASHLRLTAAVRPEGVPPEQILNIKAPEFKNFGPVPRDGKGNPLLPSDVMARINAGEAVEGIVAGVGPMAYKVQ